MLKDNIVIIIALILGFIFIDVFYQIYKRKHKNISYTESFDKYLYEKYKSSFKKICSSGREAIYLTQSGYYFIVKDLFGEIVDNRNYAIYGEKIGKKIRLECDYPILINARVNSLIELPDAEDLNDKEIFSLSEKYLTTVLIGVIIKNNDIDNIANIIERLELQLKDIDIKHLSYDIVFINSVNQEEFKKFVADYSMSDGDLSEYIGHIIKIYSHNY